MNEELDRALMRLFMKTGDPLYYTARGVFRERNSHGGDDQNAGHRTGQSGLPGQ